MHHGYGKMIMIDDMVKQIILQLFWQIMQFDMTHIFIGDAYSCIIIFIFTEKKLIPDEKGESHTSRLG